MRLTGAFINKGNGGYFYLDLFENEKKTLFIYPVFLWFLMSLYATVSVLFTIHRPTCILLVHFLLLFLFYDLVSDNNNIHNTSIAPESRNFRGASRE